MNCYKREWIESKKEEFGGDVYFIEKVIYAFTLLEQLVESKLNFVFKGGTSLLLHLDRINRLSIDIDIVCNETDDKIKEVTENICNRYPFVKYSQDNRGERGLPNRDHFRFFYNSVMTGEESNVILDIVKDKCQLPTIEKDINCYLFETDGAPIRVNVPSVEALLGDKLTAFAPETTGVPFRLKNGNDHELQVVKQLFDVGELFSASTNPEKIKEAYIKNFEVENTYSENKYVITDVLVDTKHHCLVILSHIMKGYDFPEISKKLLSGTQKLTNHLLESKFRYNNEAKIAAAKAYLLCEYISGNCDLSDDCFIYNVEKLKIIADKRLKSEIKHLEKLKSINPEAYYYLLLASN